MGRVSRAEVFDPSEVAICHVFARGVRRCFLLGNDPVTGKNYDHRKVWIEQQLQRLAADFALLLTRYSLKRFNAYHANQSKNSRSVFSVRIPVKNVSGDFIYNRHFR